MDEGSGVCRDCQLQGIVGLQTENPKGPNVGALIIRLGFGTYTIIITRNPQNYSGPYIRLGPGRSGQRFLYGFPRLNPSPMTPLRTCLPTPPPPPAPPPSFLPLLPLHTETARTCASPEGSFVGEPLLLSHCLLTLRCHGCELHACIRGCAFSLCAGSRVSDSRFKL